MCSEDSKDQQVCKTVMSAVNREIFKLKYFVRKLFVLKIFAVTVGFAILYIVGNICVFEFRSRQGLRKYFNNKNFPIYGSCVST